LEPLVLIFFEVFADNAGENRSLDEFHD
jgi:hypothetical protein